MKYIKALLFDVDSTLYTHRIRDSSAATRQTLNRLKENGYHIGIATSRYRYEVRNLPVLFRDFVFDAAIFDGGAFIMGKEETATSFPLLQGQVEWLTCYCEQRHIPVRYSAFDNDCLTTSCPHNIRGEFSELYLNMSVAKPYEQGIVLNMLACPQNGEQREEIIALMKDAFIATHSSNTLEIIAENVDKSERVEMMAAHWDIPAERIACFGDGTNDMGILQAVDIGTAMGNANPKTEAAADYVCGSIGEDRLYHFCKEMEWIQEKSCSFWGICLLLCYNRHEQLKEERQYETNKQSL